jgi:hypothetical protein
MRSSVSDQNGYHHPIGATGREGVEIVDSRHDQVVIVSPWLGLLIPICLLFLGIGVGIILDPFSDTDRASRIIGWGLILGSSLLTVGVALSRIAVFNEVGFKTLNRRKLTNWTEVLWVDVERDTYNILPNRVVVITCERKDPDGQHLQIVLDGFAGFSRRRVENLERLIDSWIEAANPGREINPWLRRPRKVRDRSDDEL